MVGGWPRHRDAFNIFLPGNGSSTYACKYGTLPVEDVSLLGDCRRCALNLNHNRLHGLYPYRTTADVQLYWD